MFKNIPWIGLTVGLIFSVALFKFSPLNESATTSMPYLASLFMAELGMLATAYSAFLSGKEWMQGSKDLRTISMLIGNILLALNLAYMGLSLWLGLQGN